MKKKLIDNAFPRFENELREELDKRGALRLYKTGEVLVKMGQPLTKAFLILQGCVKAIRENNEETEVFITYLKDGEGFAVSISEDSPNENKISLITFTTVEPTYVLTIPYADKDMLAAKFESWYKFILRTSVMYYKYYLELIDNIAFQNLDNRIMNFLLKLSRAKNNTVLQISHQEIANSLNSSREAVSRLLKKMEEAGKLKLMHNEIEIINF